MEIKIISDTHNDHNKLDSKELECDILIHCGDACTKGNYAEGYDFLYWYVKQPAKYKVLVPGNHDKKLKTHFELITLARDLGIHVLNDDYLEINNVKMYGVSQTFWSDEAGFEYTDDRIAAWRDIPKDLDILITHMPPKFILDRNKHGLPCGCPQLSEKVKEVTPKYHIFGHIHEDGGKHQHVWGTHFINCAVKNCDYITVRGAITINI